MYTFIEQSQKFCLGVKVIGKITLSDYREFIQRADQIIESEGKLSVIMDLREMSSVEPQVLAEDLKFTAKRYKNFEKLAVVGDQLWTQIMAQVSSLLPGVTARHFAAEDLQAAQSWIEQAREAAA